MGLPKAEYSSCTHSNSFSCSWARRAVMFRNMVLALSAVLVASVVILLAVAGRRPFIAARASSFVSGVTQQQQAYHQI